MTETYSTKIAYIIKSYLDSINMPCIFDEDDGTITFGTEVNSRIKILDYGIFIDSDDYLVVGYLDLCINDENRDMFVKWLTKINHDSVFGNFVIDLNDDEIQCYCYTNCTGITPTREIVRESIFSVLELVERYGDILVDIAEGKEPSEEEFEKLLEGED